jgi:hypothetical protein
LLCSDPGERRTTIEATFAGIETGTALMLMPMVLAQLPAAGKPPKDLQRPNAG